MPNCKKTGLKLSEQCGIEIKLIFPIFVDFVILEPFKSLKTPKRH